MLVKIGLDFMRISKCLVPDGGLVLIILQTICAVTDEGRLCIMLEGAFSVFTGHL